MCELAATAFVALASSAVVVGASRGQLTNPGARDLVLRLMLPCVTAPGGAGAAGSASGPRRPAPGAAGERWVVPARSVLLDRSGGRRPTSRSPRGRPRTRAVGRAGLRPLSRLAVLPPAGCPAARITSCRYGSRRSLLHGALAGMIVLIDTKILGAQVAPAGSTIIRSARVAS